MCVKKLLLVLVILPVVTRPSLDEIMKDIQYGSTLMSVGAAVRPDGRNKAAVLLGLAKKFNADDVETFLQILDASHRSLREMIEARAGEAAAGARAESAVTVAGLTAERDTLTSEVAQLRRQLQEEKDASAEENRRLQQQMGRLLLDIEKLKSEVQTGTERREELQQAAVSVSREKEKLVTEKKHTLSKIKTVLSKLIGDKDPREAESEEGLSLLQRLGECIDAGNLLRLSLEEKIRTYAGDARAKATRLFDENISLKGSARVARESVVDLQRKSQEQLIENKSLKSKTRKQDEEIQRLRGQVVALNVRITEIERIAHTGKGLSSMKANAASFVRDSEDGTPLVESPSSASRSLQGSPATSKSGGFASLFGGFLSNRSQRSLVLGVLPPKVPLTPTHSGSTTGGRSADKFASLFQQGVSMKSVGSVASGPGDSSSESGVVPLGDITTTPSRGRSSSRASVGSRQEGSASSGRRNPAVSPVADRSRSSSRQGSSQNEAENSSAPRLRALAGRPRTSSTSSDEKEKSPTQEAVFELKGGRKRVQKSFLPLSGDPLLVPPSRNSQGAFSLTVSPEGFTVGKVGKPNHRVPTVSGSPTPTSMSPSHRGEKPSEKTTPDSVAGIFSVLPLERTSSLEILGLPSSPVKARRSLSDVDEGREEGVSLARPQSEPRGRRLQEGDSTFDVNQSVPTLASPPNPRI